MYRELKVKKEDSQSFIGTIFVSLLLLGIGAGLFILANSINKGSVQSSNGGNPATAYLIIGMGALFLVCGVICVFYMFKPIMKYNAEVTDVIYEFYYETRITYIKFKVSVSGKNTNSKRTFCAYLEGEQNIEVGSSCTLYVKEFNWRVKGANFYQIESGASDTVVGITMVPTYIGIFMVLYLPLGGLIFKGITGGMDLITVSGIAVFGLSAFIGTFMLIKWRRVIKLYSNKVSVGRVSDYDAYFADLDREIMGEAREEARAERGISEPDYYEQPVTKRELFKIYSSTDEYLIKNDRDITEFRFVKISDNEYELRNDRAEVISTFVKDFLKGITFQNGDSDINLNCAYEISGASYCVEASAGTSRFFKIKSTNGVEAAYLFDKNDHYLMRFANSADEITELKIALGILTVN